MPPKYWFVIHDLESFGKHSDLIGSRVKEPGVQKPSYGRFGEIKKGDKIVYYAKGDMVVVGIFEVTSNMEYRKDDPEWGEIMVFKIKPETMPPEGYALNFKALIEDPTVTFRLFREREKWRYQIWGHTCRPLPPKDFEIIKNNILSRNHLAKMAVKVPEEKVVRRIGRPFPTIGLLYQPIDEFGVVFLFSKHHSKLGFPFILRIGNKFPDATVLDENGEMKYVELEYRSSNFKLHGHDPKKCDYIVCWEHDWDDYPSDSIQIIELKDALKDIFRW